MAIRGLRTEPQPSVGDAVGASVEALHMLGLVQDHDEVTKSTAADFAALEGSGRTGELYVRLPQSIALAGVIAVLDGGNYPDKKEYPETYVYRKLWTPGTDPNGYTDKDLGNATPSAYPAHGRLAVHNPISPREPLLHFLNKPYDEKYAEPGEYTQLMAIAEAAAAYDAEGKPALAMESLTARDVAMIALTRRIKGESMPIQWGLMRDATLPRRTVDGDSFVGVVCSNDGQLELVWSYGYAYSFVGLGLSVGPKSLEA
jgi:hypothetical protein